MSNRLYDFLCPNNHVTESLVDSDHTTAKCKVCSKDAIRVVSSPRIKLDGCSGDFPSASDRWVQVRAEKLSQEQKQNASHVGD
jgi:hypothetical protein